MRSNGSQHERDEENDVSSKVIVLTSILGCIALVYKDLSFVSIRTPSVRFVLVCSLLGAKLMYVRQGTHREH